MHPPRRFIGSLTTASLALGLVASAGAIGGVASGTPKTASTSCLYTSPQHLDKWCPTPGKKLRIVVIPSDTVDAYYNSLELGARAEGKALGIEVTTQGAVDLSAPAQAPVLSAVIQSKPDAIAIAVASATALNPLLVQAAKAGIMVFTVDNDTTDHALRITNVATDQEVAGEGAAQLLAKAMGGTGAVARLASVPGPLAEALRLKGFDEVMAKYPRIKVLPITYCQADPTTCASDTTALLQRYPDLKAVYTVGEEMGIGAGNAILAAGKQGKVLVGTFDAAPEQVNDLQKGLVSFLMVQRPYEEGTQVVSIIDQYLEGKALIRSPLLPQGEIARADLPTSIGSPYAVAVKSLSLCSGFSLAPCGTAADKAVSQWFYKGTS